VALCLLLLPAGTLRVSRTWTLLHGCGLWCTSWSSAPAQWWWWHTRWAAGAIALSQTQLAVMHTSTQGLALHALAEAPDLDLPWATTNSRLHVVLTLSCTCCPSCSPAVPASGCAACGCWPPAAQAPPGPTHPRHTPAHSRAAHTNCTHKRQHQPLRYAAHPRKHHAASNTSTSPVSDVHTSCRLYVSCSTDQGGAQQDRQRCKQHLLCRV
jgi:hypothetical protein